MLGKKDEELEKLREDMEEEDLEMEKLKKERGKHEKELYELERKNRKDLRKLREEMEEQDREVETLKEERGKHETELRDLEKKNDKELRKLLKKKVGELETLKREKDEELEDKNEELEMLRKEKDDEAKLSKGKDEELKKLREEVKKLRSAGKGDEATTTTTGGKTMVMVDSDEWHKLKKDEAEMRQVVMKKDEELQRIVNEKDAESEKLKKEKEELTKENAAETKKIRDQLLQVRHELEQRRKQSWVQTATTKLLARRYIRNDQVISRRRPVPQDTWIQSTSFESGYFLQEPHMNGQFSTAYALSLVDEDPKDWLPPPKINAYIYNGQFDKDNWWFTKTTHPDGGLTMLAYYDGNFRHSITPGGGSTVRFPYAWDTRFWTDTPCNLVNVDGELKLAFMYRE